jgi:hypothetical protein
VRNAERKDKNRRLLSITVSSFGGKELSAISKRKRTSQVNKNKKLRERYAVVSIVLACLLMAVIVFSYESRDQNGKSSAERKAAIVDQLSSRFPNWTFVETTTTALEQAGYNVDYFPNENVTVEFFRNLPTFGYGIIILRVHSTATSSQRTQEPVAIFTSERYDSSRYVYEQLNDEVVSVAFSDEERKMGTIYFGIWPSFVTDCMVCQFQSTIVVMMGCQGLENTLMAKAFVEKGAKVYISWSQSVTVGYSDTVTSDILYHFLLEKKTLKQAVLETFHAVGYDPNYGSQPMFYPMEEGERTIEDYKS